MKRSPSCVCYREKNWNIQVLIQKLVDASVSGGKTSEMSLRGRVWFQVCARRGFPRRSWTHLLRERHKTIMTPHNTSLRLSPAFHKTPGRLLLFFFCGICKARVLLFSLFLSLLYHSLFPVFHSLSSLRFVWQVLRDKPLFLYIFFIKFTRDTAHTHTRTFSLLVMCFCDVSAASAPGSSFSTSPSHWFRSVCKIDAWCGLLNRIMYT